MILIDIPQVAYRTWGLEYFIIDENGKRDYMKELELEKDLEKYLSDFLYSSDHDHVK